MIHGYVGEDGKTHPPCLYCTNKELGRKNLLLSPCGSCLPSYQKNKIMPNTEVEFWNFEPMENTILPWEEKQSKFSNNVGQVEFLWNIN